MATEHEQRLIAAGDPAAMRRLLERVARDHRIAIVWSAQQDQWWARVGSRTVSIPPPIDRAACAVGLHELGHVLAGECRGPAHRAHRDGRTLRCLECERLAWQHATTLVPFDRAMFQRLRHALGTYRRGTPAPHVAEVAADRQMSLVAWGLEYQKRLRWQMKVDAVERWKRETRRRA